MSAKQHECFSVTCDVCQESYTDSETDTILHYGSKDEALSTAEDYEWHVGPDGTAICDNEDDAHTAAILAMHAAGVNPEHGCWVMTRNEEGMPYSHWLRPDDTAGSET